MGEAKRRKQALGDRYGEMPPVLITGSEQLEEHVSKLGEAYFAKLKQIDESKPGANKLEDGGEPTAFNSPVEEESTILEMQQWIQEYFAPYRPKDREQLVMGFFEPYFFVLFDAPPEFFEQEELEPIDFFSSLFGSLSALNVFHPYVPKAKLEEYKEAMREIYWDMLNTIEEGSPNEDDLTNQATKLTHLFQLCLEEDDIPDYVSL